MFANKEQYSKNDFIKGNHIEGKQIIDVFIEENDSISMYINDNLQWNSYDECIYHEILVIPYINYLSQQKKDLKILILGGGDGFVMRELLKYNSSVQSVDMCDFDPNVVKLHRENELIKEVNKDALNDEKLTVYYEDAYKFLKEQDLSVYDLIISDLVDPSDCLDSTELYSKKFYKYIKDKINDKAIFATHLGGIYDGDFYKRVKENIKSVMPEGKFTYFPVPNFGYYSFFAYTKEKDIMTHKVYNQKINTKDVRFLSQDNFEAYLKLKELKWK